MNKSTCGCVERFGFGGVLPLEILSLKIWPGKQRSPNDPNSNMVSDIASSFERSAPACYSREMLLARDGSRSSFLAKFRYLAVMARTASCSA